MKHSKLLSRKCNIQNKQFLLVIFYTYLFYIHLFYHIIFNYFNIKYKISEIFLTYSAANDLYIRRCRISQTITRLDEEIRKQDERVDSSKIYQTKTTMRRGRAGTTPEFRENSQRPELFGSARCKSKMGKGQPACFSLSRRLTRGARGRDYLGASACCRMRDFARISQYGAGSGKKNPRDERGRLIGEGKT